MNVEALREAHGEVRERVDAAASVSGRGPGEVEIVVAGKYIEPHEAPALVEAGIGLVGENRLQDLEAKRREVGDALTFDFIGHLQRRKVRDVLAQTRLIHSVDSARLAAEIAKRAEGAVRVLVEVNIAGELTKGGIVAAQISAFIEEISCHPDLEVGGLMAMPPAVTDPDDNRVHFAATRALRDDLRARWAGRHGFEELSMGTSQDYVVAVEEGATMVRVGRGLIDEARA